MKPTNLVVLSAAVCLASVTGAGAQQSTAPLPQSTPDKLWDARGCLDDERGGWFRDAKFGAFIHFGPYSALGGYYDGKGPYRPSEQIMCLGGEQGRRAVIPVAEYREKVAGIFNPAKFDAAKWVGLIKKAGQKYVIVTTKHHDGFCMFNTATTPYNVVESTPFKRDVIKELADECRRQGIVFCPYYSIGDWCAAEVQDKKYTDYKPYMYAQLKELLTNYGEVKLMWFDNWWYVNDQWKNDEEHAKDLYAYVRSLSQKTLVNDRCGRGARSIDGDYATPENQLVGSAAGGRQSRYFEVVMTDTNDDNWGWVKGATNYRTPIEVVTNLIDCVSKGGNFVLNVGPTADGEFPAPHVALIDAIAPWIAANAEAIYATRPTHAAAIENPGGAKWYATQSKDGNTFFLYVLTWPAGDKPLVVRIEHDGAPAAALLDRSLGKARFTATQKNGASTLSIERPGEVAPYATVIKVTFPDAKGKK